MKIHVDWGNPEETILVWTFENGWGTTDFKEVLPISIEMLSSKEHTVDVLADFQRTFTRPTNLIALAQLGVGQAPPNIGQVVIISRSTFWQWMYQVFSRLYRHDVEFKFARDASEAYQFLDYRLSDIKDEPTNILGHVLYVEDQEDNIGVVKAIVQSIDYRLLIANNGEQALEMASEYVLDLILMDLHLPGMDGLEITRRMKTNPETEHIPIMALTADPDLKPEFMNAGGNAFMDKPIRVNIFRDALQEMLSQESS